MSSPQKTSSHIRSAIVVGLAAAAIVLLMAVQPYAAGYGHFRRTLLAELLMRWKDPTWQHGALMPFIVGWLVWRRRQEVSRLPETSNRGGFALVVLALLLYFAGFRANNFYCGYATVMLLLAGGSLWLQGWLRSRVMLFAWLMLGFMWPLPFLEESIGYQMRLMMVKTSGFVLNTLGVESLVSGTALQSMPNLELGRKAGDLFSVGIAAPCSGMRSLFALLVVGALFSYFRQRSLGRRLALFSTILPIAILANMTRILVLIFAAMIFGQDWAIGDAQKEVSAFHELTGILVFLVALLLLQGASWVLNQLCGGPGSRRGRVVSRQVVSSVT
ncbi:MAG: exosortase/archaeosortase family protein [Prosthecobacter sp.]|jgi:exosortase|uniref:exosortase/archaeosortase family protein n=1 Tax=Prosthecobacter sp. TaxID=1965333 RepID=UPI0019FAC025|nr:exosortase/archaeosortase family protein [Prosthecobacter sp.]MBE2283723.1 exosortase/archaeosortase family protein [Prosthecobacter sp.]